MSGISHSPESYDDHALAWGLSFARGYLELGMMDKSIRELDQLAPKYAEHPEVMSLRSHVLLAHRQWSEAVEYARRAVKLYPHEPQYYIHAATAFDMLGQPEESRQMWQSAPEPVRSSGFFHLHVARFVARLGNVASARDHLARAIDLDPTLRLVARRDPNLATFLAELAKN